MIRFAWLLLAALGTLAAEIPLPESSASERAPVPLLRAHSHNDYEQKHPLLDALAHGFCSVEADLHLVDGRLLVAHDADEVRPDRTFEALYLKPLRARIQENGGRVYRNGPPLLLLIDIKSEAESTYRALHDLLERNSDLFTSFTPTETRTNALTAIISGNRPRKVMSAQSIRYAALDGRIDDLDSDAPVHLIPLISDNWTRLFEWKGTGPFPDAERARLEQLVQRTHRQGRILRFWAVPDVPTAWAELHHAGVDLINTDNLAGLSQFLKNP